MRFLIAALAACLASPAFASIPERATQYDSYGPVGAYPVRVTVRAGGREYYGTGVMRIGRRHRNLEDARPRRVRDVPHDAPITGPDANLAERAKAYIGQTAAELGVRRSLWCSAFLRKITGASGVDDRAISWLSRPRTAPAVGAIAVMRHHVGIVAGFDARGNPILISGNSGRRVREGAYARHRIIAYVSA